MEHRKQYRERERESTRQQRNHKFILNEKTIWTTKKRSPSLGGQVQANWQARQYHVGNTSIHMGKSFKSCPPTMCHIVSQQTWKVLRFVDIKGTKVCWLFCILLPPAPIPHRSSARNTVQPVQAHIKHVSTVMKHQTPLNQQQSANNAAWTPWLPWPKNGYDYWNIGSSIDYIEIAETT